MAVYIIIGFPEAVFTKIGVVIHLFPSAVGKAKPEMKTPEMLRKAALAVVKRLVFVV